MSMGMLASSINMSHNYMYLINFWGTINKKPKSTMVRTRKIHFSAGISSLSNVVTTIPMILWCLSTIRWAHALTHQGQFVNTKKCSPRSPWSKPYTYIIFPPYFPYFWSSQLYFHKKWSKTPLFFPINEGIVDIYYGLPSLSPKKGSKTLKRVKNTKKGKKP